MGCAGSKSAPSPRATRARYEALPGAPQRTILRALDACAATTDAARAAALSKGIVAMRRIHRAFPQFSNTPYRFDAAPNAVNDWDAGFDVRAYATHGVMHGVYHYMLRGPVPPP